MTQKECHQAWNNMHDPNDPSKCCFRGPIFNPDKHIRETVLQYNLKHPEVPNHNKCDKEDKNTKTPPPPDLTEVSPPPKCSYTKISISSEKCDIQPDHPSQTSSTTSLQHHNITSNQDQTTPQKETIDSLIQFIENMETETMITPKVFMSKIQDGHLMRENQITEHMLPTQCQSVNTPKRSTLSTSQTLPKSEISTILTLQDTNIHVPKVCELTTAQNTDNIIKPSTFYRLQE